MNDVQRPGPLEGGDYTGLLRRRWLTVLVVTIICLIGALGYLKVAKKVYTATAAVKVSSNAANQATITGQRNTSGSVDLDTEAQVVKSTQVASIALKTMHSSLKIYALIKDIAVTVPANSSVMDISCNASTGPAAQSCANAVATAYLQYSTATATNMINSDIKADTAQASSLAASVNALNAKISTLPSNSSVRLADQTDLANDKGQLRTLIAQLGQYRTALAQTSGGTIINSAGVPGKPSSPKKLLVLPSGLIAGLLLGLAAAFIRDRRDERIATGRDVERLLDLPVVLSLPRTAFSKQLSLASPRSLAGQEFTELAHAVTAELGDGNHVLAVAGTRQSPAGSVVAANLAATLARTHSEVVLVCADMNDSVAAEMFGCGDGKGLAEVLAGTVTVNEVAYGPPGVPGLWVIPPGQDPSLATYHLQYDMARALTSQLRSDARYVVIEAQATMAGADTFALAEFADTAILTIEAGAVSRPQVADAIRRLRLLRTPVFGAGVCPPLRSRAKARPQRQPQQRQIPRPDAAGRNGKAVTKPAAERPVLYGSGTKEQESWDEPARALDGNSDPAQTVTGS